MRVSLDQTEAFGSPQGTSCVNPRVPLKGVGGSERVGGGGPAPSPPQSGAEFSEAPKAPKIFFGLNRSVPRAPEKIFDWPKAWRHGVGPTLKGGGGGVVGGWVWGGGLELRRRAELLHVGTRRHRKAQKEIWLVSGPTDHRSRERHGDASGHATHVQSHGSQRDAKDRRQAPTPGMH